MHESVEPEPAEVVAALRGYAKDWRERAASKDIVEQAADLIEQLVADRARSPQDAKPVAWMGYWPGAGSVDSARRTTHIKGIADDWKRNGAEITALYEPATPPLAIEALREAAADLIASRSSTFRAGNNRQVGIQDESGEKMWIVPFDAMHALEQAITDMEKKDATK